MKKKESESERERKREEEKERKKEREKKRKNEKERVEGKQTKGQTRKSHLLWENGSAEWSAPILKLSNSFEKVKNKLRK